MKYPLLLLVYMTCMSIAAFSQTDYVITTSGDTLRGKIDIFLSAGYSEEISVKTTKKQQLSAAQFLSFVKDGVTYRSVIYNNKTRIMKLMLTGKNVSLLVFRGDGAYDFSTELLYKNASEAKELPSIGFKKTLTKFLGDCPDIATADDKLFKRSNLTQLIALYNNCTLSVDKKHPATVTPVTAPPTQSKDPALDALDTLKSKLVAHNSNPELLTLIGDIAQKVKNKEKVPSYLITALKEQTATLDFVQKEVEDIIKLL